MVHNIQSSKTTKIMRHRSHEDLPLAMPRRRVSTPFNLYSPESSMDVLDRSIKDELHGNIDLNPIYDAPLSSDSREVHKKVRFAPIQENSVVTVMGLGDYSTRELIECWYSRYDIKHMNRSCYGGTSPSQKRSKADKRWSA